MPRRQSLDDVEAAIKRWQSRLTRAANTLTKLQRTRLRLIKAQNVPAAVKVAAPPPVIEPVVALPPVVAPVVDDGLTVPDFLRRSDAAVVEEIKRDQEEIKKAKARGRIAKMKAKRSGETKRMPLTGKEAMKFIRGE